MNQNILHLRIKSGIICFIAGACLLFQAAIPAPVRAEQPEARNSQVIFSAIGGCPMFPANNIWNARVDNLPVHARSDQWINTIGRSRGFHMDFGTVWDGGPIGIPYNVVGSGVPKVSVTFDYSGESDPGPYPIPANPLIEYGSDHHILIVDSSTCTLYELFDASYSGGKWYAGSGAIWNLNSNALRPDEWTSADAAGLPILPGLVRYDEVLSGEIDHAIRFTAASTNGYIWPARHLTSNNPNAPQIPPMGARFRLKASYDISGYPAALQVILRAMKKYGIILADNGSNWYVSGAPDSRWDDDMLHLLDDLTGDDFEAVDTSGLMVDYDSGATTQSVTTTSDSGPGSLRQAIADAVSGDTIMFDPSLAGQTITLTNNLVINKNLTIDGSGLSPQVRISGEHIAHLEVPSGSTVTISDVTVINGNYGILSRGTLTILDSTLKNNRDYSGGALSSYDGSLTIKNSTITENHSDYGGGALFIGGSGTARIVNSTITGNNATNNGGGLFMSGSVAVEIINSTFAGNSAPQGGEISISGTTSTLTVSNSVFACTQTSNTCYDYPSGSVTNTNSVIDAGTLTDFGLLALANNGGPTQTMALDGDSSLVDAGNDTICAGSYVNNLDQRGSIRPQGPHCDIGAYEAKAVPGTGTYDDTHAGWTYMGNFVPYASSSAYQGGIRYTTTVGNYAEFTFRGSQISILYTGNTNRGKVDVFLDGNPTKLTTFDEYTASAVYQKKWTSGDLGAGVHTVKLVHAGPAGKTINLDAIEVGTYQAPVAPGAGMYDDSDANWKYTGSFTTFASTSAYQGGIRYTTTVGDSAEFTFTGSQISILYTGNTNRGKVEVFLDNNPTKLATFDEYTASAVYQKKWTSGDLGTGTHTVKLVHAGAAGKMINLDAIEVGTYQAPAVPGAGTYDDADAHWKYTGTFTTFASTSAYQGGIRYTTTVGDYAEFTFTGSQISILYTGNTNRGKVDVFLDNNPTKLTTFDEYTSAAVYQKKWTSGDLGTGTHTVKLVHAGASGKMINLDAIEVGTYQAPGAGTYDDTHAGWKYTGTFTTFASTSAYQGGIHYTTTVGDFAEFTFTGSQIILLYTGNTNRGKVDVFLDGNPTKVATIDEYTASAVFQQHSVAITVGAGTHTIKLVHAGPAGTTINLDAMEIIP